MTNKVFIFLILSLTALSSCSFVKFAQIYSSSDERTGKLKNQTYYKGSTSYEIGDLGNNWQRVSMEHGDLFFTSKDNDAFISVNSFCSATNTNINIDSLAKSLLIGLKQKELLTKELIQIDNDKAILSIYNAHFNERELKLAAAVFKKNSCVYDINYSNISNSFEIYLKDFMEFIGKFRVITK